MISRNPLETDELFIYSSLVHYQFGAESKLKFVRFQEKY